MRAGGKIDFRYELPLAKPVVFSDFAFGEFFPFSCIHGLCPWYSRNGNKIYLLEKNCICKKVKVEVEVGFEEVIKESIIIILERHFRKIL